MKIIQVADPILDVPQFNESIPKHKAIVMVFMMEGCPHCDHLKPKWDEVKQLMDSDKHFENVMSADIDSNVVSMLPLPPVNGFPTIRVLKDQKVHEYDGIREVDPLLSFLRKTVTTPRSHKRKTPSSHKRKTPSSHKRKTPSSHKRKTPSSHKRNTPSSHKRNTPSSHKRKTPRTHHKRVSHNSRRTRRHRRPKRHNKKHPRHNMSLSRRQ